MPSIIHFSEYSDKYLQKEPQKLSKYEVGFGGGVEMKVAR